MERIFLLFCLLASGVKLSFGLEGRLFVVSFLEVSTFDPKRGGFHEIHVNSLKDTMFRVEGLPKPTTSAIFNLDSANNHSMDFSFLYHNDTWPINKIKSGTDAILVTSSEQISISASVSESGTTGAYLGLPLTKNAKEYFIASWPGKPLSSLFSAVTPAGGACGEIYKVNGSHYELVESFTLSRLQAKQFMLKDSDYTGYFVNTSRPTAIFSGHECAFVPDPSVNYCDHIVEQLVPTVEWGKDFLVVNPVGRRTDAGYFIRVIAKEATVVNVTTSGNFFTSETVEGGSYLQLHVGNGTSDVTVTEVNCDKPCEVMQYNPSYTYVQEPEETDPFMVTIPSVTHWPFDAKFGTHRYQGDADEVPVQGYNHILIMSKWSDRNGIRLNGQELTGTWNAYQMTDGTMYAWLNQTITPGYYTVDNPGNNAAQMAVIVSGNGAATRDHTAWAYMGGYYITDAEWKGSWYNITAYEEEHAPDATTAPSVDLNDLGLGPGLGNIKDFTVDITSADLPYYEVEWIATYYTKERGGKIISRQCSEGYGRSIFEYELQSIKDDLNKNGSGLIAQYCGADAAGITGDLSDMSYHSEYTRGQVRIFLTLQGTPDHTLDQVINCAAALRTNLRNYRGWSGGIDIGDEDLIKQHADFNTHSCAPVFFKPDVFEHKGEGWLCHDKKTVVSLSGAESVMMQSLNVMIASLCCVLLLIIQAHQM